MLSFSLAHVFFLSVCPQTRNSLKSKSNFRFRWIQRSWSPSSKPNCGKNIWQRWRKKEETAQQFRKTLPETTERSWRHWKRRGTRKSNAWRRRLMIKTWWEACNTAGNLLLAKQSNAVFFFLCGAGYQREGTPRRSSQRANSCTWCPGKNTTGSERPGVRFSNDWAEEGETGRNRSTSEETRRYYSRKRKRCCWSC